MVINSILRARAYLKIKLKINYKCPIIMPIILMCQFHSLNISNILQHRNRIIFHTHLNPSNNMASLSRSRPITIHHMEYHSTAIFHLPF